jgi:thiol:disulfide interchange protein DsbA
MNRRQLTQAAALAPLSCLVGHQAIAQAPDAAKQADNTRPFRAVNVPEDGRRVLFFFDFACPFCANYHEPLLTFAETVPRQVQTLFVPVVNVSDLPRKSEQMIAAKCFYAAFETATKPQMAAFTSSVYISYQTTRSLADKRMWAKAVKDAGLSMEKFALAMRSANNDAQIRFAARKTVQYALRATPSVGVGGRFVITPEDVAGDQSMFFNILNGLVSETL